MSEKPSEAEWHEHYNEGIQFLTEENARLCTKLEKIEPLGYLASIAAATPEQLEELRMLCKPGVGR